MWFLLVLIKFLFLFADGGLSFLPYLGFPPSDFILALIYNRTPQIKSIVDYN
nr:MAG TPA: hypothetical protein [Caudoviricetes sp.]